MSTYEISKSSLLSLKAEILRKQEELSKVKSDNAVKIKNLKKSSPLEIKNKGVDDRRKNDLTEEEENLLRKSRSILEAKSKLYDKLSNKSNKLSEEQSEISKRYLVRFDKKRSKLPDLPPEGSDTEDKYPESEDEYSRDDYDAPTNKDDEWVEFVDCLGRTRTCLRKDLEHIKANDAGLKETHERRKQRDEPCDSKQVEEKVDKEEELKEPQSKEESELISSDMRRELLREQWEKEEEILRNKDDIHYQDILFSEARTHGVGYYAFSKDEEERAAQQEALKNLRNETEAQQKKSQDLKALREKQLAARIKAAKDRRRARLGLPPEEEPEETPIPEKEDDNDKNEEDMEKEAKEKLLEKARKKHVRPWDIGKSALKEHYVYSQDEWVDKRRKERINEFAPPSTYRKNFTSDVINDVSDEEKKELRFSSTKKSINPYKRRNNYEEVKQNAPVDPTPIVNEVDEYEDRLMQDFKVTRSSQQDFDSTESDDDDGNRGKGPEFAPPPTIDYYGPSSSKKPKQSKNVNIQDSIEAGLKFLRKQIEKKQNPGKRDADMFIS